MHLTAQHLHCLHTLQRTREALDGCYAALEAIRGALRLMAQFDDPQVAAVLLGEIWEIVEESLRGPQAANDWEVRR